MFSKIINNFINTVQFVGKLFFDKRFLPIVLTLFTLVALVQSVVVSAANTLKVSIKTDVQNRIKIFFIKITTKYLTIIFIAQKNIKAPFFRQV